MQTYQIHSLVSSPFLSPPVEQVGDPLPLPVAPFPIAAERVAGRLVGASRREDGGGLRTPLGTTGKLVHPPLFSGPHFLIHRNKVGTPLLVRFYKGWEVFK